MKTELDPSNAPHRDTLHALGWQDRVLLAPMSGVTDRPFRDYIRNLGQGQVVTEMIASEAAIRQVKDSENSIKPLMMNPESLFSWPGLNRTSSPRRHGSWRAAALTPSI